MNGPITFHDSEIIFNSVVAGTGGDGYYGLFPTGGPGGEGYGGGVCCDSGSISEIDNCIVADCQSLGGNGGEGKGGADGTGGDGYGGGVYCGSESLCDIENNTVTNCNAMGGDGEGTSSVGYGGGVYSQDAALNIIDSILWGNIGKEIDGSGYSVTYSCLEQPVPGSGNIYSDPCFVSGPLGGYYLSQIAAGQATDSPCVDAGSDTAANLGLDSGTTRTDEIGDIGMVDMGFHYPTVRGDLNNNGIVNFIDFAILADQWQSVPGIPSADIWPEGGDGIIDKNDLNLMLGNWMK